MFEDSRLDRLRRRQKPGVCDCRILVTAPLGIDDRLVGEVGISNFGGITRRPSDDLHGDSFEKLAAMGAYACDDVLCLRRVLPNGYRCRIDYRACQRGGHVAMRGIAAKIEDEIVRVVAGSGNVKPSLKGRDFMKEFAQQVDRRNRGDIREFLCCIGQEMFVHELVEQRGDPSIPPEDLKQCPRDKQSCCRSAAPRKIRDDDRRVLHEHLRVGIKPACHDLGEQRCLLGREGCDDLHC